MPTLHLPDSSNSKSPASCDQTKKVPNPNSILGLSQLKFEQRQNNHYNHFVSITEQQKKLVRTASPNVKERYRKQIHSELKLAAMHPTQPVFLNPYAMHYDDWSTAVVDPGWRPPKPSPVESGPRKFEEKAKAKQRPNSAKVFSASSFPFSFSPPSTSTPSSGEGNKEQEQEQAQAQEATSDQLLANLLAAFSNFKKLEFSSNVSQNKKRYEKELEKAVKRLDDDCSRSRQPETTATPNRNRATPNRTAEKFHNSDPFYFRNAGGNSSASQLRKEAAAGSIRVRPSSAPSRSRRVPKLNTKKTTLVNGALKVVHKINLAGFASSNSEAAALLTTVDESLRSLCKTKAFSVSLNLQNNCISFDECLGVLERVSERASESGGGFCGSEPILTNFIPLNSLRSAQLLLNTMVTSVDLRGNEEETGTHCLLSLRGADIFNMYPTLRQAIEQRIKVSRERTKRTSNTNHHKL